MVYANRLKRQSDISLAVFESDSRSSSSRTLDEFQAFAELLPNFIWIANAQGQIEWYNSEFRRYTGRSLEPEGDWSWLPFVHDDDRPTITHAWAKALKAGSLLESVVRIRSLEGSYRWFRIQARPHYATGASISQWFGTLTDVHERQLALDANLHLVDALMKGYLAKKLPVVAGLRFDTFYQPANVMERLGGDWYDTFPLPDGRVGFSLGDVCGHGINAAVKMGEAKQAIFIAACLDDPAPKRVMERANKVIFLNDHHVSITTALYGIIDTKLRTVTYASAGHHPPILARRDAAPEILPNHGFPLGVEEHMPDRIKTHSFTYESGSTLVLYTDGLIEFNHDIDAGERRLLAAAAESVRCQAEHPATFIAKHVLGDATPSDDVAISTISFIDA